MCIKRALEDINLKTAVVSADFTDKIKAGG